MSHYYDHIKNFGAPNRVCSSITKSKHISVVKRPWRRSNKHVPLPQMLKANARLDKLAAACADFLARGMLVDSCLIQAIKDIIVNNEGSTDDTTGDSDSESDISSEAEFHHSHINNSNCTRDPNGNTDTSYEQLQTLCPPPQMLSASQAEDNDCGPVESGPLMNKVRLVSRKAPTRQYPTMLVALSLKIGQHDLLDLAWRFLFYQLNPSSSVEPDQLLLSMCPVVWDSKVSVYHSATATFRVPSNPSGPGGMYREVIRSTPFWSRGTIPGPRRDCVFVDAGDSGNMGMKGLLVA